MIWALLWACGGTPEPTEPVAPPPPPTEHRLSLADGQLQLDGQPFTTEPDDELPVVLDAGATTQWTEVRKTLEASKALKGRRHLSGPNGLLSVDGQPRVRPLTKCKEPVDINGVAKRLSVNVIRDENQHYVRAAFTFLPRTGSDDGPVGVSFLPRGCWKMQPCAEVFEGDALAACEQAAGAAAKADATVVPDRLDLAGPTGCLLPIAKNPEEVDGWSAEVARALDNMGLTADTDIYVLLDEDAQVRALTALLDGIQSSKRPAPTLSKTVLGFGDGPAICTAQIDSAAPVELAAARWYGSQL